MPLEIERKFLLKNNNWKSAASEKIIIKQGYLNICKERTVRVRVKNKQGIITVKGETVGMTRKEFEYEIPFNDALELLELCEVPIIEKERYAVIYRGLKWEVDIFGGANKGLEIAEVELDSENQNINIPDWTGKEVTFDERYYNSNLVKTPFENW